jgi:hypothetical protein
MVASSFAEVKAQCLPFPAKDMKVEKMINWVAGEVQTMPITIWQLNNNFGILAIEGILIMLNKEGCQKLSHLRGLATSSDASVLQDIPDDV